MSAFRELAFLGSLVLRTKLHVTVSMGPAHGQQGHFKANAVKAQSSGGRGAVVLALENVQGGERTSACHAVVCISRSVPHSILKLF